MKIETAERSDGSIDYVLIDDSTGEQILRGEWAVVRQMERQLSGQKPSSDAQHTDGGTRT